MLYPDDVNYWREVAEKHVERVKDLEDELISMTENFVEANEKIEDLQDKINTMTNGFKHIYEKAGEHF